jgi:SAM-dependent methyltransferase
MPTLLAKQLRKPSGFFGKLVAKMMEFRTRDSYKEIIAKMSPQKGDHILEIGYGPGLGIYQIASYSPGCMISGIDYSELMFHKASKRNKKFIDRGTVHLQYGDVLTMDMGNDKFDKIFCVNVIYFWNDLDQAFKLIFKMLREKGIFLIYMDHMDTIEKVKLLADFCKYPVEVVEEKLKNSGFTGIEYNFDVGYYVSAKK